MQQSGEKSDWKGKILSFYGSMRTKQGLDPDDGLWDIMAAREDCSILSKAQFVIAPRTSTIVGIVHLKRSNSLMRGTLELVVVL